MDPIDTHFAKIEPKQRAELERIRKVIKQTAPEAEEQISYGMPAFKYKKKYLIAYDAFKDHLSIFPGSEAIADLHDKLAMFKVSKGTIQFTLDNPIPESVIKEVVLHRIKSIDK